MDALDRKLVRELQENIPPGENPWIAIAGRLGISEEEVVERLKFLKASGRLKRVGAVLRHQNSGFAANAMAVFSPSTERTDELGKKLAESPLVSHCYERAPCGPWFFTLYAMIHGRTEEEISGFVSAFAAENGVDQYEILFSREELKKSSLVFFGRPEDESR